MCFESPSRIRAITLQAFQEDIRIDIDIVFDAIMREEQGVGLPSNRAILLEDIYGFFNCIYFSTTSCFLPIKMRLFLMNRPGFTGDSIP